MKKLILTILILCGAIFGQSRSVIFNTGSPDSLDYGYVIDSTHSAANRIYVANDYVLEAMVFYVTLESINGAINISFREDNNGTPGELINETAEWVYELSPFTNNGYNLIVTTDQCIYLDGNQYYWLTIEANDDETEALWVYSNSSVYTYATSENDVWTSSFGNAGAAGVWAEQIYSVPYDYGDVNFDFVVNVVDIVNLVGHILETNILDDDALEYADINSDAVINVVDVVALINIILSESSTSPNFSLEDINPASEFYSQEIGPSFFDGQVSCYYFGKQGWSTCKARFGVLNDLYNELVSEGIDDVKMMGINGYQYINDTVGCMICDDSCSSSTCDAGPRILPWTQDNDDGINCDDENEGLCTGLDESGDVWDLLDASLRDFIILDKHGVEFARINLTYNNPDPTDLGECSGNYQKIKDLILAARNR